ncbi:MAG: ORF6N domain-containing protein [bacterium]
MNELIPIEIIENKIFIIRGQKVMLDSDLAQLYEVETKNLNKAVKRNPGRFPEKFMFQLTKEEWDNLKFQIGTSSWGGKRKLPQVFTEHGTLMLSSVLNSKRAIAVSIQIIEVFDKLKQFAFNQNQLTERISSLEQAFMNYAKENTEENEEMHRAINYLLDITKPAKIGFKS